MLISCWSCTCTTNCLTAAATEIYSLPHYIRNITAFLVTMISDTFLPQRLIRIIQSHILSNRAAGLTHLRRVN